MAIGELEAILSAPADEGIDFDLWVLKLIELQAQGRDEEVSRQLESMNRSAAKTELRKLQEKNDQLLGTLLSPAEDPRFTRGKRADPPLDVRAFAEAAYAFLGVRTRLEGNGRILCVSLGQRPDQLFPTWQRFAFEESGVAAEGTTHALLAEGTKAFVDLGDRVLKLGGVAFRSCLPLEADTSPEVLRQSIDSLDPRVTVGAIDTVETSPNAVWGLTWVLTTRASRDRFDKLLTFLAADNDGGQEAIERLQGLPPGHLLQLPPLDEAPYSRPPSADAIQRQLTECVNSDKEVQSFVAHYRGVGEKKIQDLRSWHQQKSPTLTGADRQADVDRDRALLEALRQEYTPSLDARVVMVSGFVYRRMEGKATFNWTGGEVTFTTKWTWVPLTESGTLHLRCTICSEPTSGPNTTCDAGHLACDQHIHRCAIPGCSRRACPQCLTGRLTECPLSGLLACPEHLGDCASCASEVLAPLLFRVEELLEPVCAECFDICEASGGLHLTTELERSEMSGVLVHHRLLLPCAETGRRALASELAACAETGALVDPSLLETCASSGRVVLARLLVESPVSAKRFLPSCGARDEVSGELCLPEELSNCAVSGRRVRLDRLTRSTLSGIAALPSEMVACPISGDLLLPSEAVRCEETGRLLSPQATTVCELTHVRAGRDLFGACSISGQIILLRSLAVSTVSGELGRPDLMGVDEVDGALALPGELDICSVSGRRVRWINLVRSEISDRRAQPGLLVQCQETQKRVCPDELLGCQATGALVVPTCLAIDEVTGKRVLDRLLVTCGITGKRTLAEATEECVLSGIRAIRSECEQCAVTGQWAVKGRLDASVVSGKPVLPALLRQSAVTARKALPEEMVRCQESGSLAIPGELENCALSGKTVLPGLLTTCPDSGIRLLTRLAVRCDFTGALVHPDAIGISEVSGRLVRSSFLKMSEASTRRCIEDELRVCAASGKQVLEDELERCAVTGKGFLPVYLGPCAICDRRSFKKGHLRCVACEAYYCADCIEKGQCRTCRALARPLVGIWALDDELQRVVLQEFPGAGRVCFGRNLKWVIVYAEPKMLAFSQKSRLLVIERRNGAYSVLRSNYEFRLQ